MLGWTFSGIDGGRAYPVHEGAIFSWFIPAENMVFNGDYAACFRSNSISWGVLTSDLFVPIDSTLNWLQLSENENISLEYRILDNNNNVLKSSTVPIITTAFGSQQVGIAEYIGKPIRIEFRQQDLAWGRGFTLLEDIRNGNAVYRENGTFESTAKDYVSPIAFTTLDWLATVPAGSAVRFQIATNNDNSTWNYVGPDGTSATFYEQSGSQVNSGHSGNRYLRWKAYFSTTDLRVSPVLHSMSIGTSELAPKVLWQTSIPVNLAQNTLADLNSSIGAIGSAGKYYLKGTFTSATGQIIATAESPFFVVQGNTALTLNSDKKIYRPGETVTINGEVKNLSSITASGLSFLLKNKASGTEQILANETFSIPAGASHPFTVTTIAGAEGTVPLTGTVAQGTATLAEIADQYEIAAPKVTAALAVPDVAGNEPFTAALELKNNGKTDAAVSVASPFGLEQILIPAGQTKLLQYSRQISADTTDTFTISGDLAQTLTRSVNYGLAGAVAIAPQTLYPEGKISLPVTVTNTGLLDGQFTVNYQLTQGANSVSNQTKSYFLPKGGSSSDTLTFDLAEGSYQLTASGRLPAMSATTSFSVRKEVKADLQLIVGTQTGTLLPATVNVTNLGYNTIDGTVRLSLVDSQGAAVWSASQDTSLPQALVPAPQSLSFIINLAALKPAPYTIRAELLDNGNRQLSLQSAPYTILGPIFVISQVPPDQTVSAGGDAIFTFRVKNSGNQEGAFDLSFKADDLIDSTRTEWLKPGEEKEIAFSFTTAADMEEKDYFATYNLKNQGAGSGNQGTVKYHLLGINLAVTASLDKQSYYTGDTAVLSLTVTQKDTGASPNLFARVNYGGYNEKQNFTLNGSQTLVFTVPLTRITGEKLFYGIYADSGRSIHLNTIYVYKADGELAIATDKQVYNPGETVTTSISGSATGELTLSGPGGFTTTFAYSGSDTRSFTLPATMTVGTYTLNAQLKTQNSQLITVSHPFDVAGIQVKVKEALLDKTKYAAADAMQLSLIIESNRDLTATVRTWVVDPSGNYTEAGSSDASLTAAQPSLFTLHSSFFTGSLGIHKLVYGIYQGDLLLASGSKAFDIGEAMLLSLATDRSDYGEVTLPVTVKADLYGTVDAGIEFFLDGTSIRTGNVALNGMGDYTFTLQSASVPPGLHTLKGVLTVNGLTSSREVRFTYGSNLPDLVVQLSAAEPKGSVLSLAATVTNLGKTAAAATTLAVSDGNPGQGGATFATLAVPPLAGGASVTIPYDWRLLGKAGDHTLYAQIDPDNRVTEFLDANNGAILAVSIPSITLGVSTSGASFKANSDVGIAVDLANLGSAPYQDLTLKLAITGPAGAAGSSETAVAALAPVSEISVGNNWNTAANPPGNYRVDSSLASGGNSLVTGSATFTVEATSSVTGTMSLGSAELIQGAKLGIDYTLANSGNIDLASGETKIEIVDKNSGTTAQTFTQPFAQLNVLQSLTQAFAIEKLDVPPGDYTVKLTAMAAEGTFPVDEKALRVLPSLEVTKKLSLAPRVLVFIGKEESKELAHAEATIRQALEGMGVYHAIVRDEKEMRKGLRSGFFNSYLLAGRKPLTGHLDEELAERINSGDGLILGNYGQIEDGKFRDVAGIESAGSLLAKPRVLTLLQSPITSSGSGMVTGKVEKLRVNSTDTMIAASVADKEQSHPALVLHPYGEGKVVVFAFDPDVSLLQSAVGYVAPARVDSIPVAPLPVELTIRSLGAQFDLKITETVDTTLPILHTYPLGAVDQQSITWKHNLGANETKKFSYLVGLTEESGIFDLFSEVSYLRSGSYELYKAYPLIVKADKGLVALKTDILVSLQSLTVAGKDAASLNKIIGAYAEVINKPVFTEHQADEAISELLELTGELRKLLLNTAQVRLDLGRLLRIYERKWSGLQYN